MKKVTLASSLPRRMQFFFGKKLREGRFSTPSTYIISLIRDDQDLNGRGDIVAIVRRLLDDSAQPAQDAAMTGTGWKTDGTPSRPNRRRRISAGREI